MAAALALDAPPSAGSAGPRSARPRKAYGLRAFLADRRWFRDAFRNNIRVFLHECADAEGYEVCGMPVWRVMLVDERSGVAVPLFAVEESVDRSPRPFCEYCRCSGWGHHFVSKRRYHFIIPPDAHWGGPLRHSCLDDHANLLHGLLHCNGFGHLISVNGRKGGSRHITGCDLMDLWDRICTALHARQVTVEDLSQKSSMQLRLLLGVAYGGPWFARWGYRFHLGNFGVTEQFYAKSLDLLSAQDLHHLIRELEPTGRDRDLRRIIFSYVNLNDHLRFSTVRSLFRHLLDLLHSPAPSSPATPAAASTNSSTGRFPRDFDDVAVELNSRWSLRRLRSVAEVVVGILIEHGRALTRQEVRDMARIVVGDTGLLDFVLKSLGDCIVGHHVVRRKQNPSNRIFEFTIEPATADQLSSPPRTPTPPQPRKRVQVEKDVLWLYKHVLLRGPLGENVLNAKRWVKTWPLLDEDERLRYLCAWVPSDEEVMRPDLLTRPLPPPVLVVLPLHASVGDLRREAGEALRDTYCVMGRLEVTRVDGLEVVDEREPLFAAGESGREVWVSGVGADWEGPWRYEGEEGWTVECACGARDDDGERMLACDVCETWQHTRCVGIADGDDVPRLFLCVRCAGSLAGGKPADRITREAPFVVPALSRS